VASIFDPAEGEQSVKISAGKAQRTNKADAYQDIGQDLFVVKKRRQRCIFIALRHPPTRERRSPEILPSRQES